MFKDHRTHSFGQQVLGTFNSQTLSLIKQIKHSLSQNKGILQDIQSLDPNYVYKLYQPIKYEGINQMFVRPLILRQIDQLMQQKQILIKKKEALNFVINCENNRKQMEFTQNNNHYSFLRTTWTKLQSKGSNSSDKLDNINKIVILVKSNIKNLIENQHISIQKELQNGTFNANYLQNEQNIKIRQQIQRLRMRNQDLQSKHIELQQIIHEKNNSIQQLRTQLQKAQDYTNQMKLNMAVTNEKILALKRTRSNPQAQTNIQQQEDNLSHQLVFHGISQNFKIKISSNNLYQNKIQQTTKTLNQIIQFIRSKSQSLNYYSELNHCEFSVPCLNLNHSLSTNEASLSDRYLNKFSKFIPIKTKRSCKSKNMNKTMVTPTISQEKIFDNIQVQPLGMSPKKFHRKVQFPLTSDRFRQPNQLKISEQRKSLTNDNEIVDA